MLTADFDFLQDIVYYTMKSAKLSNTIYLHKCFIQCIVRFVLLSVIKLYKFVLISYPNFSPDKILSKWSKRNNVISINERKDNFLDLAEYTGIQE